MNRFLKHFTPAQDDLPKNNSIRLKQSVSVPDASWFKGESMEYVRRTLMGENAKLFEYMDKGVLRSLVEEHLGGVQNRRLLVWSLLNVEECINRFFDGGI